MSVCYSYRMNLPAELTCCVCMERAEGYHFGAVSCAACGAFFRRSVSDQKTYACASRSCIVINDKVKRESKRTGGASCRYCRFLKCVRNGMLPGDVREKRHTSPQQPYIYRTLPEEIVRFIDELVSIRRRMQISRSKECMLMNGIQAVIQSVSIEYELLRGVWIDSPILHRILPIPMTPISEPSIFRDILATYFVFETGITTSCHGGVQLDRLIYPNFTFIELSSQDFCHVFGSGNMSRVCSFLVQNLARNFQKIHFDETYQAVLFFAVLIQSVPLIHRNPENEMILQNIISGLDEVDKNFKERLECIVTLIHHGTQIFKQTFFSTH